MMRNVIRCGAVAFFLGLPAMQAQNRAACNDACLRQHMDRYLTQMTAHKTGGLDVAPNAEIRENTVRIALGGGNAWSKVAAIKSRQDFTDPSTGNIVSRSAVDLGGGKLGSYSVRLEVDSGKITEIESTLNPGGRLFDEYNMLHPDIIWDTIVPKDRRSTREQLIKIADLYFDAIRDHGGSKYEDIFAKRCDRYESGRKMSNDSLTPSNEDGAQNCYGTLRGLKGQDVEQRRYPLVDVERGVVLGYGFIQHRERNPQGATGLAELFKIVDGRLQVIENIEAGLPYPLEGGFTH